MTKVLSMVILLWFCALVQASPMKSVTGTLPCRIIDASTQLPITNASVCITVVNNCLFTNNSGEAFFDSLPPDIYTLYATADNYDSLFIHNISTKSGPNTLVTFELSKANKLQELDKIVVNSSRIAHKAIDQINGVTRLSRFDLTSTAGTANDVNRVLQTLPSVITLGADYDNTLFVRGGSALENTTVIDGITFENPNHFSSTYSNGGAIGYVNGELVDGLDFYAGAMPALLPAALSSATVITLRNGSHYERRNQFDLNMSGLSFLTEGPLGIDKSSYLFNIRYNDIRFLKRFIDLTGTSQYGDSHLKFTIPFGFINTLSLTNVGGFDLYNDSFLENQTPIKYRQKILQNGTGLALESRTERFRNRAQVNFALRLETHNKKIVSDTFPITTYQLSRDTIFSPPLFWDFGNGDEPVTRNQLQYRYGYSKEEGFYNRDDRWHLTARNDFTLFTSDKSQIDAGASATRSTLRLAQRDGAFTDIVSKTFTDSAAVNLMDSMLVHDTSYGVDSTVYNDQASGYLQSIYSRGPLKLLAGVRGDYWSLLRDYAFSPRAGISVKTAPGIFSLNGGLLYNQPSELNKHLSEIMTPNPNWQTQTISFHDIELQRAWHLVGSYEKNFWSSHMITLEGYYKFYDREYTRIKPDYYEYTREYEKALKEKKNFIMPNPRGKKKAYGIELTLQKKEHTGLYYTIAGSLFDVKNRYANGEWYDDINNVKGTLNATLGTTIAKNHTLSLRAAATGGRPYCSAIIDSRGTMTYDTTNGYFTEHLEPRMSVNFRYSFKHARLWGNFTGYIEILNLLNTRPIVMREFSWKDYWDTQANGIIPVAGFTLDF